MSDKDIKHILTLQYVRGRDQTCIDSNTQSQVGYDTKSIFLIGVKMVWIQNLPFPRLVVTPKLKNHSQWEGEASVKANNFIQDLNPSSWFHFLWQRETNFVHPLLQNLISLLFLFANGPGDQGSIPGRVIPKTQKMVLDAALLSTQHYKVRIKGKGEQSREWSSTLPYTSM